MTLEELYTAIDADYADVMRRIPLPHLIEKYMVMFLDDTSCPELLAAWHAGEDRAAFDAAHSAKGVCANLALTPLATLSDQICEALRKGNEDLRAQIDVDALVEELGAAYAKTTDAIRAYAANR